MNNVRHHFNSWIPEDHLHALRQEEQAIVLRNRILAQEMGRLLAVFRDHGIRALPVKGAVLAQASYGDLNLRTFSDLDIVIEKGVFDQSLPVLREVGYEPIGKLAEMSDWARRFQIWQSGQCPFVKGKSIFHLDLHTRLMPPLYYYASDLDDLWERAVEIEIAGLNMRVLCPEDRILLLSYHGMKNRWERFKYVCDVAETVRSTPGMDWDFVFGEARSTRGKKTLALALLLASTLRDERFPDEVVRFIDEQGVLKVSHMLDRRLRNMMTNGTMSFSERFSFQLSTRDTLSSRFRYGYFALLRRATDFASPL